MEPLAKLSVSPSTTLGTPDKSAACASAQTIQAKNAMAIFVIQELILLNDALAARRFQAVT
jgi:hypothetical protein